MKYVITINANGSVKGLYSDRLPYRELGPLAIDRASTVEWDAARQVWRAVAPDGKVLAESASRDECIRGEVAALQGGVV